MAAIVHVPIAHPFTPTPRFHMHGRLALALLSGALSASVFAGCSSGRDEARTDSARADSAAASAMPAADSAAAPASSAATLLEDIRAAENAWRIGLTGGDTVELGRITAPGFTMVGPTGPASTVTRASLMKQISQGEVQADSSSISDLTVNGTGDSATADLTFYWRVSRMGKAAKGETMKVTDTWVKRDGRWQLAARKAQ
jgi:hypothetical protein